VAVAACGEGIAGPAVPVRVEAVRIIPFGAWLFPGDTVQMVALPYDSAGRAIGRRVRVAWRSGSPAVAAVDTAGRVTAAGVGVAVIFAEIESVEDSALVHVLPVPPEFAGFRTVVAGSEFTCALDELGAVACWGLNVHGQLGNGGGSDGTVPAAVSGLFSVRGVAAGNRHACALDAEGTPWCWGWNSVRQVGPDVLEKVVPAPRALPLAGRHVELAGGSGHTCALRADGVAACWGAGGLGQLGGGAPVPTGMTVVIGTPALRSIVAGHAHSCALDPDGRAWCWGWNLWGQLGSVSGSCSEAIPCSATPAPIRAAFRFTALAAGSAFTCGLDPDGTAWCWGANAAGQLGGLPGSPASDPVRIRGVPPFVALSAGREHACGLTGAGAVFCWGENRDGQLGDGTVSGASGPVAARLAPRPAFHVAAGGAHTCAIAVDGRVHCWGANSDGQLGPNPSR
jgi:alpha-tubulin suppressor-like RCC1 family protein